MKTLIFTAILLISTNAVSRAETITCSFTEPFFTAVYNTSTQRLSIDNQSEQKKSIVKNVSFQIVAPGSFVLRSAKGVILASLLLNKEGSDGMSDAIYPYSVTLSGFEHNANSGIGGCFSTLLPIKNN